MMYLIFLIILIVLIIIYNILLAVKNKPEKFINYNSNEFQFQLTPTNNEINIFELVSHEYEYTIKKINIYGLPVCLYECVDMPSPSDSIFTVFTSFRLNKRSEYSSGTSLLASLRSSSPESVSLRDVGMYNTFGGFNYIIFNFPDEIKENFFTRFEINFADTRGYDASRFYIFSFNNSSVNSQISIVKIPLIINNRGISQSITFIATEDLKLNNPNLILLVSGLRQFDIASIRIYFKSSSSRNIESQVVAPSENLRLISSNQNEQIDIMGLNTLPTQEEEETQSRFNSSGGITNNLNLLTKLRVPWAVYDANSYNQDTSVIIDQVKGGGCRNATVSGQVTLENDNISYIKGSQSSCIEFPEGSMPKTYTICAITKYDNPSAGTRLDILKTVDYPKIVIGHSNNTRGVVSRTNQPNSATINCTSDASDTFKREDLTNWVVTCIKSNGKDFRKTIIINDERRGNRFLEGLERNNKLIINLNLSNYYRTNCSEFGFAYLIIWDQLLSDNELVMVSRILNNYINESSQRINIHRNLLTIKDGSTMFKAANSARDIMENYCITKNGRYWINTEGSREPEYVFCIMDKNCNGGGWMLAMKGSRDNTQRFNYNSSLWTTRDTFQVNDHLIDFEPNNIYMERNTDAKYYIYNTFRAKECLAIFDPRDFGKENNPNYYTYYRFPQYGWIWHNNNFNNGNRITLLDFFSNDKAQFFYSTPTNDNKTELINYIGSRYDQSLVKFLDFENEYKTQILYKPSFSDNDNTYKGPCNLKIWSTQSQYYSFGFNVGPVLDTKDHPSNRRHRVRWGGSYNENLEYNSKPLSNDVSGGIGMEFSNYNAGDGIQCCHNTVGQNRNFSFKWFIR